MVTIIKLDFYLSIKYINKKNYLTLNSKRMSEKSYESLYTLNRHAAQIHCNNDNKSLIRTRRK